MQSLYVISEELAGQTESALANLAKHTLCVFGVSKSLFHVWGFFLFSFSFESNLFDNRATTSNKVGVKAFKNVLVLLPFLLP